MMTRYFIPLTSLLAFLNILSSEVAVNWGGDYVSADANCIGLVAGEVPFSMTEERNPEPGPDYGGESEVFYGGLTTFGTSLADVWNVDQSTSPGDSLRYRIPEPEPGEGGLAVYIWKKEDFLNGLSAEESISLSQLGAFHMEGRRYGAAILSQVRFIFQSTDGQFYISDALGPIPSNWGVVSLSDPGSVDWFVYTPASDIAAIGSKLDEPSFNDITAVGVYLYVERGPDGGTSITSALSTFRADLNIGDSSGDMTACLDLVDPANNSALAVPVASGELVYRKYTPQGDILLDYSHCGYGGGGKAYPEVPVVLTVDGPSGGDDRLLIQDAIDSVAQLQPDANGVRGAILLKKGTYRVSGPLRIKTSGIVLRGEGADELNGTVLLATASTKHSLIEIKGPTPRSSIFSTSVDITDAYVPSGAYSFTVADASAFAPGDTIIVRRRSTAEWITAIGMDQIPPRSDGGQIIQWQPGAYDLMFDRIITSINGNTITVDAPLANAFQEEYGGGYVYRYSFAGRIENVGIEDIAGVSEFDDSVTEFSSTAGKVIFSDENHGWTFITFDNAQNGWVSRVSSHHFGFGCVDILDSAKWITVEDSAFLEPVSKITGGRRYPFDISGHLSLVINCFAEEGRHDFAINGGQTPGPNAFVNCRSVKSYSTTEPHQRWSVGGLWDNVSVEGPSGWMMASNRGNAGTGHGWAGAQMVFWNCRAAVIGVLKPPTAQNFAIGMAPPEIINPGLVQAAVNTMNSQSGLSLPATAPHWGDGYKESPDQMVYPRSLYFRQLQDRLGQSNETFSMEGWLARHGVPLHERLEEFDSDDDGLSNLVEYYVGNDPLIPDAEKAYTISMVDDKVIFSYKRMIHSIDAIGRLEHSPDMVTWTPATLTGAEPSPSSPEIYTCEVKLPIDQAIPKFFRLNIQR